MGEDQSFTGRQAADYFGSLLMENVRDLAILYADKLVDGDFRTEDSKRVSVLFASFTPQQRDTVHRLIPEVVDKTLALLLNILDADENIEVNIKSVDGQVQSLRDASDDLNLEIYGWIAEYSHQRSHTFTNIQLPP